MGVVWGAPRGCSGAGCEKSEQGLAQSKAGQGAWDRLAGLGSLLGMQQPLTGAKSPREPPDTSLKSPACGELHALCDAGKGLNSSSQPPRQLHPHPSPPPGNGPGSLLAPANR